jgi:hypothetical protein
MFECSLLGPLTERALRLYMTSVNETLSYVTTQAPSKVSQRDSSWHWVKILGLYAMTQQCYTSWGHVTAELSRGSPRFLSVWTHLITDDTLDRHMPPPTVTPCRHRRGFCSWVILIPSLASRRVRTGWGQRGSLWCAVAMLPSTGFNALGSVLRLVRCMPEGTSCLEQTT